MAKAPWAIMKGKQRDVEPIEVKRSRKVKWSGVDVMKIRLVYCYESRD